jgi:deoxyribose-phosphate aldolase
MGEQAVCVRGPHVQRARRALAAPAADAGGPPSASPPPPRMAVACVVNFPAGTAGAADVLAEAGAALAAGATELDVVLDAAAMRAGRLAELLALLRELRRRADAGPATPAVLKLILETAALTPREAGAACALAARARWDFVKTSTGYAARGASLDDVRLMAAASRLAASACAAGPGTVAAPRVKASGGIRTWAQAVGMIDVGADRIGTSAGLAIMREARERAAAAAQD